MATLGGLSGGAEFFYELLNDSRLRNLDGDSAKSSRGDRKTGSGKSRSPKLEGKESQKENSNSKKAGEGKSGKRPRKSTREPLKAVDSNENPGRRSEGARGKKPSAAGAPPPKASPRRSRGAIGGNPPVPKIRVYRDAPRSSGGEGRGVGKGRGRELSKPVAGRKSSAAAEGGSPKPRAPRSPSRSSASGATENPTKAQLEEAFEKAEAVFPNADPEYLRSLCGRLKGSLPRIIEVVIDKEKAGELPTRADYLKKMQVEEIQQKYLGEFSPENFLKAIPDPWDHFLNEGKRVSPRYSDHSLHYLKNKFKRHHAHAIREALQRNEHSLYLAHRELKRRSSGLKLRATNRSKFECDAGRPTTLDPQFLHEVAFIENEDKIRKHVRRAEKARGRKLREARAAGTLLECHSCRDPGLLREDAVGCPADHVFCRDCMVRHVEAEVAKENLRFDCPAKCEEKLELEALQKVLSPAATAEVLKRLQLEEIRSAGIEGLVGCPFCHYVAVVPPEISVLRCLNPSCMAESCRHCGRRSHVPLRCDELGGGDGGPLEGTPANPARRPGCQESPGSARPDVGSASPDPSRWKSEPPAGDFQDSGSDGGACAEGDGDGDGDGTPESKYFDPAGNFADFAWTDSNSF